RRRRKDADHARLGAGHRQSRRDLPLRPHSRNRTWACPLADPYGSGCPMRAAQILSLLALCAATAHASGVGTRAIENQELRAQLSPRNYTTLAAEISAKVDRITVKEGQAFRRGQVLVSLDCSLQQAQQQRAKAE